MGPRATTRRERIAAVIAVPLLVCSAACSSSSISPLPVDAGEEPDAYGMGLCLGSSTMPNAGYGTCIVGSICPQSTLPAIDSTSCTVGATCCLRQCTANGGGRCVPTGMSCAPGETMGTEEACGTGFFCCQGGPVADAGTED